MGKHRARAGAHIWEKCGPSLFISLQVLDLVTEMLDALERRTDHSDHSSDADLDGVAVDKLRQLKQVLSMQPFSGINRKIQVRSRQSLRISPPPK